jgi:gas vesicle protein
MKKFVSVNAKYYKNSNAAGELGHVNRLFKDNVNAFKEYTKDNFGSSDNLMNEYKKIHEKRNSVGKKAQKKCKYLC